MPKMTMTSLIKYCTIMAGSETNPEDDWSVQRRRYKAIAEYLQNFDAMNKRDDRTTAVNVVKVGTGLFEGKCHICKTAINSKFDFCPKCGRPIDWESSKKIARKI